MKSRWRHVLAMALLGAVFALAGCEGSDGKDGTDGSDGMDGANGDPGQACWDLNNNGVGDPEEDINRDGAVDALDCAGDADPVVAAIASAKVESCTTCHHEVGEEEHQAVYDQYAGNALELSIVDVTSELVGETWSGEMIVHIEKNGVPLAGLETYISRGNTRYRPVGTNQASFYTVQYDSESNMFVNSASFSFNATSDLGGGDYVARTSGRSFDPVPVNGQAYAYVASDPLETEGMELYANVTNTAIAYGDVGNYASPANPEGCSNCHGTPYLKHGYRAAKVDGLQDFSSCKSCHYDTRNGGHEDWQYMVDDPYNWATAGLDTAVVEAKYAYKAKLMNDVHMSHAMEFPYPQSMANCATCHEGKLDRILADENFRFETCKSCHPVEGNGAWPDQAYEQDARATPFTYLWTVKHNVPYHLDYTNLTTCTNCHNSEPGAAAPAFAALHTGYDPRIYMADGTRYTDVYTASIDSIARDGNTLTIKYGVSDPDVVDNPLLAVSFYGWDTKHFIVPAHLRAPCSDGSDCRFEYRPSDLDSNPIFTQTANSVAGAWEVTVDLTAWNGDPDSVPDLIAANDVRRVEVSVIPTATIDGVGLGLNTVSKTFDLAANAVDADWFKLDKAVVNVDGCNACHDKLGQTFHGSFGVGGVEGDMLACKHCHNPTFGGSHLELASRSIDNYVHTIHSFQDFDPGDIFEAPFDPVFARRYSLHIEHTFPNFTIKNCEACHTEASLANAATYNVPDQSKSMPSLHRGSDDVETASTSTPMATWYELVGAVNFPEIIAEERPLSDRNVANITRFVAGPASRSCGGCHRAHAINEDNAGELASWNAHTQAFGTYAEIVDNGDENTILFGIIDKIMTIFE